MVLMCQNQCLVATVIKNSIPVNELQSFWDHLDELRGSIIRMIVAVVLCAVVVFCLKDWVFAIVLAPQDSGFITYSILEKVGGMFSTDDGNILPPLSVRIINTGLAQQFLLHVKMSAYIGIMLASPYVIYQLFLFIVPALYHHERRYVLRLLCSGLLMFVLGIMLSYYLLFPLTFRFLGMYQISQVVENTVTIESYIDTMLTMSLSMGIVFEIPVLCWILGKMGLIGADMMRRYRRHVVVALIVLAAIITPTADVFTLLLVSLPMCLLYEISIHIVRRVSV